MGASFWACEIKEKSCCDMRYGYVHHCRMRMLEALGRIYDPGTEWRDKYEEAFEHGLSFEKSGAKMFEALFAEMDRHSNRIKDDPSLREIVIGCRSFCCHSDCEGGWASDYCEAIASAIRMTMDTIELDERERRTFDQLHKVFTDGSEEGCEVRICRPDYAT